MNDGVEELDDASVALEEGDDPGKEAGQGAQEGKHHCFDDQAACVVPEPEDEIDEHAAGLFEKVGGV